MQEFHDIRPPVPVGMDPVAVKILLILLGAILLAALLFFLIRNRRKNRKGVKEIEALALPLSPFEEATEELDALSRRPMDDPRLFYFDLTRVLRRYLGRAFGINALEMTSEEFVREAGRLDLEREVKKEISQFQALADPYKYAGVSPEKALVTRDLDRVRDLVSRIEQALAAKRDREKNETKEAS